MKRLLLIFLLSFSNAHAAPNCEDEALPSPAHFISLIKRSLESGALRLEDVKPLADEREWQSPFVRKPKSPENLSLRHASARALRSLTSISDRELVRAALKELIRKVEQSEQQIDQAKVKTQSVFSPEAHRPFGTTWHRKLTHSTISNWGKIIPGTFESRPVFLTGYEDTRNSQIPIYSLQLFDPFHPDPSLRIRTLFQTQSKDDLGEFGFVEHESKTYAQIHKPLRSIDLATQVEVQLAADPNIPFQVFSAGERKFRAQILPDSTVVLRETGKPDWTYGNATERKRQDLTVFSLDGRIYVGFIETLYDESTDVKTAEIFRVDLETKEIVRTSQLPTPWVYEYWQHTHHAHTYAEERSYLVSSNVLRWNWRTMEAETLFETRGMVHHFEFDKRAYILMGQKFFDPESANLVLQLSFNDGNNTFTNFTYQDDLYAIGITYDSSPILIQFTKKTGHYETR